MTAPAPVPDGTTPPAEAVDAAMAVLLCKRAPAFNRCAVHEFKTWDGGWTDQGCPVAVSVAAAVVAALRLPERDRETAAKALDGAAAAWSDWDALDAPEDWLRDRASALRERKA